MDNYLYLIDETDMEDELSLWELEDEDLLNDWEDEI